ncbi:MULTISPECIES: AfsR/SARP family transcriptional regulator [Kitasatospora]|uniref:Putative AfsR family transcriptional regulator n=1 Tax=Kitasatospora setae (strain ATCC 33774 / DSM 43861 / JCM 3304 / KCC A-0304 / NBRC 14216 / KM-6054) TaxID=452652 RepID=E4NGC8_KITSK|nr:MULTISPECIES: AfsR/SARP family transcriptional regulator [Kitasatospora]BAJ30558.1 putative AfsR family transcriptional regulator [Kitasatospora setae KM-6054]
MEHQDTRSAEALRFQVLGPVQAWRGGVPLALGSPQQQAVLVALLLSEGRPVTTDDLVDGIWGDRTPPQAVAALRTYVSRLRSVLEPNRAARKPSEVLVSMTDGYALRIPADALDSTVFEQRVAEASAARTEGGLRPAHDTLVAALDLWRGRPLPGVPGPYAETQRGRLAERQLAVAEERCALALEIGLHADVVAELNSLSSAYPLRERLRELLMLALYRSGRQAESLGVYADTRKLLIDELGVEPGGGLSAMHARILAGDPDLLAPSAAPPKAAEEPAPFVPPAQLPADVSDFSGRGKMVNELRDVLRAGSGQAVVVTSLAGIGGVGKTTLAVHVAHSLRPDFPDGQLYVDLRGAGASPADPAVVLGDFLHALGSSDAPDSLEQRAALYRSLLADKRMLILLDNARDAGQLRPLIPGVSGNAVMVTSRSRLAELPGAHLVDIEELTPDEALALFSAIVGAERVGAEPEAALQVVTSCGFLPLAVRIAAARLASRPRWSVSDLARRLADQRNRLQELQLGNLAVETTLGLGYAQLRPDEARAFRLLALVDSPDLPLSAVTALLGVPEPEAEELAEALVEANMLECFTPGRYRYHDLLRLYAQRQNAKLGDEEQQQAALLRLLDLLDATMQNALRVIEPDDLYIEPLHRADSPGRPFPDNDDARDWLRTEMSVLLSAVEAAANAPLPVLRPALDILLCLVSVIEEPILAPRIRTMLRAAAASPAARQDPLALACVHSALGQIHRVGGELADAESELSRSLELQSTDRPILRLITANALAIVLIMAGRPAEALSRYEQAREVVSHLDAPVSEARLLGNMARSYVGLDRHAEAEESARAAVAAARASGNVPCLADTLYQLGVVLRAAGSPGEAALHLREAYELYRQHRHPIWEGYSLARLAACLLADGQFAAAAEAGEESLSIAREIEAAYCQGMANAALGEALLELGQPSRGLACLREALAVFTRLGVPEAQPVQDLIASRHTEPSPPPIAP